MKRPSFQELLANQRASKAEPSIPTSKLPHQGVGAQMAQHEREEVARRKQEGNSWWSERSAPAAPETGVKQKIPPPAL
jgi:hypothetical protein